MKPFPSFPRRFAPWALLSLLAAGAPAARAADVLPDYRYQVDVLAVGLAQPLQLKMAPDGRLFFNELLGKLRIWKPATQAIVEAGTVPVFGEQENGLLGFAFDPGFAQNNWLYLYYSPTNYVGQRLSRFVMRGDTLDLSSEKVMLEFAEQRRECCHHAGSVQMGPDGCIYISSGDNTHPFGDSESFGPMDERPGREPWDAQKGASNTHDLRGKIIRIRPTPEGGYTIPPGNLFPADGSKGRPEIFVMGCRNPWRMTVESVTGYVYWGEVGPDASNDGKRGSRGYDEINQAKVAGNYGWPYFVGRNFPYAQYNYTTKELGPLFDPQRPVNNSPNNTGSHVLPPAQPALIYWPYGKSTEWPELGEGGRTAVAGQVYHYRPEFEKTGGFPKEYDNCLLFGDWQRPLLKWARLDAQGNLVRLEPFTSAVAVVNNAGGIAAAQKAGAFVIRRPEDSFFGPDGCLYMVDYGETWGANPDSKILRISYQRGNLAPVVQVGATPTAGREPLTVALSSAGTRDYEGDALTYEWRLHPGGKLLSTEANPRVTVAEPGNYAVELTVNDGHGGVSKASLPLVVGNSPPRVRFLSPRNGDFFTPGQPVAFQVLVEDQEDGSSRDYAELMEARAFVSAHWSQGDEAAEVVPPGLALMRQNDCFNCHAINQKIVGPAYLDVANPYRGPAGALEASVQRVLKGSSGVWSPVPMLAHERLTADQVQMMVRWVYDLKPGAAAGDVIRGLAGRLAAPAEILNRTGVLEATYTDAGRPPVAALVGRSNVTLRNHRVEAEDATDLAGTEVQGAAQASGKKLIRVKNATGSLRLVDLNLAGIQKVTCRIAAPTARGALELRRGSVTGEVLARFTLAPTGAWNKWIELTAPLTTVNDRADVVAVFSTPDQTNWVSLDWLQFDAQ